MSPTSRLVVILVFSLAITTVSLSVSWAHMILRAKGDVRLKREGAAYRLTGAGEAIEPSDLLKPEQRVDVIVFCDSEDKVDFRPVPNSVPSGVSALCPTREPPIERGKLPIRNQPGGSDPSVPYTIHPRWTYLLKSLPTLRWNGVQGAKVYTVRVLGEDNEVKWEATSKATQVAYPQTAPGLKWGVPYRFSVQADTGASSLDDAGACLGFKLLNPVRMQKIQAESSRMAQWIQLAPDEIALARAHYYSNKGLIGEAIETLEALVTRGNSNPLIYRQLARVYAAAGLNLLADTYATQALAKYRDKKDTYGIAGTQDELTKVREMLGKKAEANKLGCAQITWPRD